MLGKCSITESYPWPWKSVLDGLLWVLNAELSPFDFESMCVDGDKNGILINFLNFFGGGRGLVFGFGFYV